MTLNVTFDQFEHILTKQTFLKVDLQPMTRSLKEMQLDVIPNLFFPQWGNKRRVTLI